MRFNELYAKEKQCRMLNIIRILMTVVLSCLCIAITIIKVMKGEPYAGLIALCVGIPATIIFYAIINAVYQKKKKSIFPALEKSAMETMGISSWKYTSPADVYITLNSSQAATKYDEIKYFKENEGKISEASAVLTQKREYAKLLKTFLENNEYKALKTYKDLESKIKSNLANTNSYNIGAYYSSPKGRSQKCNYVHVSESRLKELANDKSLLMSKSEYNKYLKEHAKEELEKKQHFYYEKVNKIIDYANEHKESLVNKNDAEELDRLIASLFDRTVNSIKKTKSVDSEEWDLIDKIIKQTDDSVNAIVDKNNQILEYYDSEDFQTVKSTCDTLMSTQREFNEYIDEKVNSISELFGKNVIRNETAIEDEYNYIHPYKKSITPFTAEVSAAVFASAENSPLEYVVKQFYPNKDVYPEQIRKLQLLVEELETLKEAKQIIENYKKDVQQYLSDVPAFIIENDEDGFYARLGFATINENTLTVEYKFSYTSNGGKAQRSFTIPMTEETIVKLIEMLESKLTMSSFTKEQRSLMTSKLRMQIKERDNFTCKLCGNSTHTEPNLLLEVDHIIPVAKGGYTVENNLQTLCWKCNRSKSAKIL